jgi:ribulose-phosphate 3-epimerase
MLDYILDEIDRVLILTVNPGFHSQPLVKQAIVKIKHLSKILEYSGQTKIKIVADGNVNLKTSPDMYQNGAREFVLGKSGLFNGDILNNYNNIVNLINTIDKGE